MKPHNINYRTKPNPTLCNTKHYKAILYIIFLLLCTKNTQLKAQVLDQYEKIKLQKIDSVLAFNNSKKNNLKYLTLLPNLSYDLDRNAVNIGVSLSNLTNYYQTKERNKIELERLRFQLLERHETQLEKLTLEYETLKNEYELHQQEQKNQSITTDLYNLKKQQYEKNKITLEEWLTVQQTHQNQLLAMQIKRNNLRIQMQAFALKTKSSCFEQELNNLINRPNN